VLLLILLDKIIPFRHPAIASSWYVRVEFFDFLRNVVFLRRVPAVGFLHLDNVVGSERCTMRACLAGFGTTDTDDTADVDEEGFGAVWVAAFLHG
jgi:hypothetical protein